jgi:2-phospho-L-lactate guanylyltransferase
LDPPELNFGLSAPPIDLLLPVKDLSTAKSRLKKGAVERRDLALSYLSNVVRVSLDSSAAVQCWIVSPEDLRCELGITACERLHWIEERGCEGLNRALEFARLALPRREGGVIGVVLPDLPWLTTLELRDFFALHQLTGHSSVTLACDRHGRGTNGLLLDAQTEFCYRFGPDSFNRHTAQAWARQMTIRVFRSAGTANDVDVPADLIGYI